MAVPPDLSAAEVRLPPFEAGMRIGLFGGSFDPPHEGHLQVSRVALRALALDQVWWLVSPQNPLKKNAPSDDLAKRIAAARALAGSSRIKVTGIEATLGTNYTAEAIARLKPRLKGVDLVWMMGADNLATFHRWRNWRMIVDTLPIAVFNRPHSALAGLASPAARALSRYRLDPSEAGLLAGTRPPAWVFLPSPHVAISSTELRTRRHSAS